MGVDVSGDVPRGRGPLGDPAGGGDLATVVRSILTPTPDPGH